MRPGSDSGIFTKSELQSAVFQKSRALPISVEPEDDALKQNRLPLSEELSPLVEPHHPLVGSQLPRASPRPRTRLPIITSESSRHNESSTRFEKCAISVSMPENSEVGTLVTTLKVLNRKKWTLIDMVDPDGTFEIRQKTGEVVIRDNRIMDRELFTNLELVAEIHGSSHLTKCARVRVNVELLDQNDNRPTFEKEKYVNF
ncbi:hypothetical protein OSTOST_06977 [Ostertagia ostertagi]